MTRTATRTAHIKSIGGEKAATDLEEGQFRALVAVFDNIDRYGDVILPGAFTDTLKAWDESGDPIPVVWSHQWQDVFSHIGQVTQAHETEEGLEITGTLDLDNPTAAQVHRLMKARRIKEFSFAYDIDPGGGKLTAIPTPETKDADDPDADDAPSDLVYALSSLTLHEVGPCLKGVNPATRLDDIKATPQPDQDAHETPDALNASRHVPPPDHAAAPGPRAPGRPRLNAASLRAHLDALAPEGA